MVADINSQDFLVFIREPFHGDLISILPQAVPLPPNTMHVLNQISEGVAKGIEFWLEI